MNVCVCVCVFVCLCVCVCVCVRVRACVRARARRYKLMRSGNNIDVLRVLCEHNIYTKLTRIINASQKCHKMVLKYENIFSNWVSTEPRWALLYQERQRLVRNISR